MEESLNKHRKKELEKGVERSANSNTFQVMSNIDNGVYIVTEEGIYYNDINTIEIIPWKKIRRIEKLGDTNDNIIRLSLFSDKHFDMILRDDVDSTFIYGDLRHRFLCAFFK